MLLLNVDLHFAQFRQLLLKLFSQRIFLGILRLELLKALIGFFECLSYISILLLSHANGLILLGQRIFVGIITLTQQAINLILVHLIVFTRNRNLLSQSVLDFSIQPLNIEIHVVLMELLQHLLLGLDVAVDTEERWYLFILDVDQVFVWQVAKQDVTPLGTMVGESVKNARLLPRSVGKSIFLLIGILLILDELIVAILINCGAIFHVTICQSKTKLEYLPYQQLALDSSDRPLTPACLESLDETFHLLCMVPLRMGSAIVFGELYLFKRN